MRPALALTLALAAGPAVADCASERTLILDAVEARGWAVEGEGAFAEDGTLCTLTDLELVNDTILFEIGSLSWQFVGLDALEAGSGVITLDAGLDNLRATARSGDDRVDWMLREQNRRNLIDGTLSARWDLDEGRLALDTLSLDFPGDNAVALSFVVGGFTSEMMAGQVGDLAALSLTRMTVDVENTGFADGLILGYMLGAMTGVPGPPESIVAATRAEVAAMVEALPVSIFDADSKAALGRLIDEAPVPWGRATLAIAANPALPLSRFPGLGLAPDPLDPDDLTDALDGVTVEIRYQPAPDPE